MAGIVFGCIVPHPPLLVPDIGHGQERAVSTTANALEILSQKLAQSQAQTLVVISPHGEGHADAMGVATAKASSGSLRSWGSQGPDLQFDNDLPLVQALQQEAHAASIPLRSIGQKGYELDHGVMVPLHFLIQGAQGLPLVPLTFSWLSLPTHYGFGQVIHRATEKAGRRVAIIASGDLSHRLPSSPYGFEPKGPAFDKKIVEAIGSWNPQAILDLDSELIERAGECGLRSILILLGALDGLAVKPEVLSYEGPFGVGYLVAACHIKGPDTTEREMHPIAKLAKDTVECYMLEGKLPQLQKVCAEMQERAGVFVSLKKHGELRGCIGTFEPTQKDVAQEIMTNAISSATRDPRFTPITPEELPYLEYSVDVLTPPQPVESREKLNPKVYGVIVESRGRRGLLLPDIEGVDNVEQQIDICCHKAGIRPGEPIQLYCFQVRRFK